MRVAGARPGLIRALAVVVFGATAVLASALPTSPARAAGVLPGLPGGASPGAEAPADAPSQADLRELARLLSDPGMRTWLEREARRSPADSTGAPRLGVREWLAAHLRALERDARLAVAAWSDPGAALADFRAGWRTSVAEGETLRSLVYVLIFVIVGAGLEWLYWRYAGRLRARIEAGALEDAHPGAAGAALRAVLALLGIALFAIGTLGTFATFEWPSMVEVLALSGLLALVAVRVVNTLVVLVLCPRFERLRPVPLSTPVARFAHRWVMALVGLVTLGSLAAAAVAEIGTAPLLALLVSSATATLCAVAAIAMVWRLRRVAPGRRRPGGLGADLAPVFATFAICLGWLLWMVGARGLFWTLVAAVGIPLADRGFRAVIGAAGARARDATGEGGAPTLRGVARHGPVIERLARFVLVVTVLGLLGVAWGIDLGAVSDSATPGGRVFEAAVDVLVAYLIADLVWVWARTAIDVRMSGFEPPEPGHAPGPEARLATLLPLLRKVLAVALFAMVVLVALSSLGVNVGPLIAGAGVVGIAVGFGAQTLVRDIVSGVFFLLDDAFRVGEYIEVGDLRGTVESISVRSIRLRHHRGAVHTIPFGEMKSLTNHSRDWVIMKLEFQVPFDTDVGLIKKLVKRIGQELQEHEELGQCLIEAPKSQGVRRMEEFNMVVGVKFMAKPGEQWTIRKEVYQRVRDAFDANGIGFAERNVKVEVIGAGADSAAAREAALGAAQEAIERQIDPQPARP